MLSLPLYGLVIVFSAGLICGVSLMAGLAAAVAMKAIKVYHIKK